MTKKVIKKEVKKPRKKKPASKDPLLGWIKKGNVHPIKSVPYSEIKAILDSKESKKHKVN